MNHKTLVQLGLALLAGGCSTDPGANAADGSEADSSTGSAPASSTSTSSASTTSSSEDASAADASSSSTSGRESAAETSTIECMQHSDCWMDAFAPICSDGACVPCGDAADDACGELDPMRSLCAPDGRCVGCTAQHPEVCPASAPSCNAETNLCFACTDNDDCSSGVCQLGTGACFPGDCIVDVAADGSGDTTSIMEGLELGCSVRLHAGDYAEVVVLDDVEAAIFAAGDGEANIVASGTAALGASVVVRDGANVYLQGIVVDNWSYAGVWVDAATIALDRVRMMGDLSGATALRLTGGAEASVRTSFIGTGASYGAGIAAVVVDASSADILASTISGYGDDLQSRPALTCIDPLAVTVRNSVLVLDIFAQNVHSELHCDEADVTYTATNKPFAGEGNVALGDYSYTWFEYGDLHLASPPAALLTTALWRDGDPSVDIDGDPRPAIDGMPDVAGADVP